MLFLIMSESGNNKSFALYQDGIVENARLGLYEGIWNGNESVHR